VGLFSIAVAAVTVGIYFIFDFYLTSVSRELMASWVQSEIVAIQEGHLLTSITKNQRVLLSSQFVKGVVLLDTSVQPPMRLIEVGQRIEPAHKVSETKDNVQVVGAGFFEKQSAYRIPRQPELLLIFDVAPGFLQKFFFSTVAAFLIFIIILFGSIKAVQRREFLKREDFLKQALNDFIDRDEPSQVIEERFPFLVQWWKSRKVESERNKRIAIENESKILLGELAARVAHDIRSPLNTLSAVTDQLNDLPESNRKLLTSAVQRIREIANGIGDRNKQILQNQKPIVESDRILLSETESTLLYPVLDSIVCEKSAEHRKKDIEINLKVEASSVGLFAKINELELRRTLSNLIENAVEAITPPGKIEIRLQSRDESAIITITDDGKGIPKKLLSQIGTKGMSFGKDGGSGLGVFYAKEVIHSWGGQFGITSKENSGTQVTIALRSEKPPAWMAQNLELPRGSTLIILDDDSSIHAAWQERLKDFEDDLEVQHFFDPPSIQSWFVQNREKLGKYSILSDYELRANGTNGLDVIERLGVNPDDVLLVTSAFDDRGVQSQCAEMKIRILPKPFLPYASVVLT